MVFKIIQKIEDTYIGRNYPDILSIDLGYVEDEFFAIEFCNTHPGCEYYHIIYSKKYDLEAHMVESNNELELIYKPVKKWEEY